MVTIIASSGPTITIVPNVVGLQRTAAETAITNVGLTVGPVTQASHATVPAGAVISQSPVAGGQRGAEHPGLAGGLDWTAGADDRAERRRSAASWRPSRRLIAAGFAIGAVTEQNDSLIPLGDNPQPDAGGELDGAARLDNRSRRLAGHVHRRRAALARPAGELAHRRSGQHGGVHRRSSPTASAHRSRRRRRSPTRSLPSAGARGALPVLLERTGDDQRQHAGLLHAAWHGGRHGHRRGTHDRRAQRRADREERRQVRQAGDGGSGDHQGRWAT